MFQFRQVLFIGACPCYREEYKHGFNSVRFYLQKVPEKNQVRLYLVSIPLGSIYSISNTGLYSSFPVSIPLGSIYSRSIKGDGMAKTSFNSVRFYLQSLQKRALYTIIKGFSRHSTIIFYLQSCRSPIIEKRQGIDKLYYWFDFQYVKELFER